MPVPSDEVLAADSGSGVAIVPVTEAVVDEVAAVLGHEVVRTELGWPAEVDGGFVERVTRSWTRRTNHDGDAYWLNWLITDSERAVGFVQAELAAETPRTAVIAYTLLPEERGRGVATTAAALMVGVLSETGLADRLEAHIADSNVASQAVARRLGLEPTDRLDDAGERVWSAGPLTPGPRPSP